MQVLKGNSGHQYLNIIRSDGKVDCRASLPRGRYEGRRTIVHNDHVVGVTGPDNGVPLAVHSGVAPRVVVSVEVTNNERILMCRSSSQKIPVESIRSISVRVTV